jgi:cation transport ATPase
LIIAAVFSGAYFIPKYLKKKNGGKSVEEKETKSTVKKETQKEGEKFFSILHIGVGLLTVILTVGLTFLIYFLSNTDFLYNLMYSGPWMIGSILSLLTAVLLYFVAIFGPAIFVAIKKGWKSFLSIIVMAVLWAIFFMIVGSVFLQAIEIPVVGIY